MKNTILALSIDAVKQEITAQCAWVDATNLTTLPPIVNPVTCSDIDAAISHGIDALCHTFSAYITSTKMSDTGIFNITMPITSINAMQQSSLAQKFNDLVVFHGLHELYSTQTQATHISAHYQEKLAYLQSSAKQLLAIMQ